MIIVIRGTNGSGKSHAVRQIIAQADSRAVFNAKGGSSLIHLPEIARPVFIIGPYEEGRSMGGCDCIRRPSLIYDWIDEALAMKRHVLLEGVILATKPWFEYRDAGEDVRYLFLDPPPQYCFDNIDRRQRIKGQAHTISLKAMAGKLIRAQNMFTSALNVGMPAKRMYRPPINAAPWILEQLRSV